MKKQTNNNFLYTLIVAGILLTTIIPLNVLSDDTSTIEFISFQDAQTVAEHFIQMKNKNDDYSIKSNEAVYDLEDEVLVGHLFHLSPTGYIIIAPSMIIHPVIAYSFTSNAPFSEQHNPLHAILSADISNQLDHYHDLSKETRNIIQDNWNHYLDQGIIAEQTDDFQQWPPEGTTSTEGWIETKWHQNAPYNDFCPIDPLDSNRRSVAGCPAITMGQILNYHKTINNIRFDDTDDYHHNYLSSFWIDNDHEHYQFPSFPELNNYLSTVDQHFDQNQPLTDQDVAAISFACGVACKQVYSSAVSGTFGVDQAYDAYQRFNCDNATLHYTPDDTIYDTIIENIQAALPVHFAVVTPGWDAGHNLIIDGYNTDDFYHLNFGWGGSFDGWYLIPESLPYQLTVMEGVIVDILRKTTSEDLEAAGSIIWQEKTKGETAEGSFTIQNTGEQNSLLSWEIASTPEWGEWTITPTSGHSIRPVDGNITVQVSCTLPNQRGEYSDSITIINTNNPSDRDFIPVSVTLAKNRQHTNWFIEFLIDYIIHLQSCIVHNHK